MMRKTGSSALVFRISAFILIALILLSTILPNAAADRTFTLNPGEVDSDVVEGGEEIRVFVTVTTPNASIDVYVIPTELFSEDTLLQEEFEPLEEYTRLNLTTNITYSFVLLEDEYSAYEVILDNSDNIRDNDTVPWLNETIEVIVRQQYPEHAAKVVIYKGIIAAFIVTVFIAGVVAKFLRNKILGRKNKVENDGTYRMRFP